MFFSFYYLFLVFLQKRQTSYSCEQSLTTDPTIQFGHISTICSYFSLTDDQGYADVGFTNPSCPFVTPNIDLLASSAVKLDDYYVHPTCTPTRAALLTGRLEVFGVSNLFLPRHHVIWGTRLVRSSSFCHKFNHPNKWKDDPSINTLN